MKELRIRETLTPVSGGVPQETREADLDVTTRGSFINEISGRLVSPTGDRGAGLEPLRTGVFIVRTGDFSEVTHNWLVQMVHNYFWRGVTSARGTCRLGQ